MNELTGLNKKSATMDDVALRAGVSKASASTVLHGSRGNTRVAQQTRERILAAARDLNYSPNGVAQALRRRKMNVVGLYLGDWVLNTHDLFLAEIVGGLQVGCHEHRKDLLIHGTFRGQSIDDIYSELINGKIDGLVMFVQGNDKLVGRLAEASVPVVAVADAVPNLPSVVVDDRAGSRMMAEYLAGKGHRKVLYCRGTQITQISIERRYQAFCETAAQFNMTVIEGRSHSWSEVSDVAKERLQQSSADRPTAVVGCTDWAAYAVIEYCRSIGLKVPDDIAVVGFDGITPPIMPLRLTTIRAPWMEVARVAVGMVAQGASSKSASEETVLPVEFFQGETG